MLYHAFFRFTETDNQVNDTISKNSANFAQDKIYKVLDSRQTCRKQGEES